MDFEDAILLRDHPGISAHRICQLRNWTLETVDDTLEGMFTDGEVVCEDGTWFLVQ